MNRYAPEVPEDVRGRVILKLEEAGYTFDWQVSILPREVLLHLFPFSSHGLELTAVLHAQRMAEPPQKEGGSAVAEQFERMIAQQKKHTKVAKQSRRTHNNDAVSSSESGDDIGFDATECLKKYGLPSIDHGHLMPFESLRTVVKAAQKRKKKAKDTKFEFVIDKEIYKCMPQWSSEKDKPSKGDMTHAQWVAAWWSRALGQLTVQAAIGHESAPVEALLSQFLHCNRIAVQDTVRTAQCYDSALWSDLAEASKRKDKACDPTKSFSTVDENRLSRARHAATELAAASRAIKGSGPKGAGKGARKTFGAPARDGQPGQGKGTSHYGGWQERNNDTQWRRYPNGDAADGGGPMRTSFPWIKKKRT